MSRQPSAALPEALAEAFTDWGLSSSAGWVSQLALVAAAALLALAAHQIARRLILRAVRSLAHRTRMRWDDVLVERRVFQRLTHLVPALVLYSAAPIVFAHQEGLRALLMRLTLAYMFLAGAFAASALLAALVRIYETSFEAARERPIRSYVQVVSIFLWMFVAILVIAALTERSPWGLLGGLGAMTAVLMLVFKDSILGLVASVQLAFNDMVRVGDWIEMPQFGADGAVIEILLTTVKVQNWDKTITTIPTYRLISDAFKNWRGMSESGGRRIKRSLLIDLHSIRFVDEEMLGRFKKIQHIREHLERKLEETRRFNEEQGADLSSLVNGRHLTNIGTFRAYVEAYLRNHPDIRQDMTFLVRQLPPVEKGLPLEIYVFSREQRWAYYEAIQADIFDHILAVVGEFDLRVAQLPTGADLRAVSAPLAAAGGE